jgi:germination protein YpeB
MEASSYYLNHTQRSIGTPTISRSTAKSKLSLDLNVKTCRLSLVPVGNSSEKLCYEFSGELDGATYYVYIDATTGRQVQMFKVIESSKGMLLM